MIVRVIGMVIVIVIVIVILIAIVIVRVIVRVIGMVIVIVCNSNGDSNRKTNHFNMARILCAFYLILDRAGFPVMLTGITNYCYQKNIKNN